MHGKRSSNRFDLCGCVSYPIANRDDAPNSWRSLGKSDAILAFLYAQISENSNFHMRHKWERNDVVIWDNQVSTFSPILSFD